MNKQSDVNSDGTVPACRTSPDSAAQRVEVGEVKAAFGVKGWVKVFSYTRPAEQIFSYRGWLLGKEGVKCRLEDYDQRSNGGLIAKIEGIDDRTTASMLAGKAIAIHQSELAVLEEGYYWSEIIGLDVFSSSGEPLGQVTQMIETGANDVMVVRIADDEHLIPYADSIVQNVELEAGRIIVEWQSDY